MLYKKPNSNNNMENKILSQNLFSVIYVICLFCFEKLYRSEHNQEKYIHIKVDVILHFRHS